MYKYQIATIGDSDYYSEFREIYIGATVQSVEPEVCGVFVKGNFTIVSLAGQPSVSLYFEEVILKEIE